jgi:hypothetical protein
MNNRTKSQEACWTELIGTAHPHRTSCGRCTGLLVSDWFYDLKNPGEHRVNVLRCVQCGHRVDPTIVQNRIRPSAFEAVDEGAEYQHAMNREHVEDAAVSG